MKTLGNTEHIVYRELITEGMSSAWAGADPPGAPICERTVVNCVGTSVTLPLTC